MTKVGYVLHRPERGKIGSIRIQVLSMLPYLAQRGYTSQILFEPDFEDCTPRLNGLARTAKESGIDIVYFHKVYGGDALRVVDGLRRNGIKTVFGICDVVSDEMVESCDHSIAVSDYLKGEHSTSLQQKIQVLHDGIERQNISKMNYSNHYATRDNPIRAVLLTSAYLERLPLLTDLPGYVGVSVIGNYTGQNTRRNAGEDMGNFERINWQLASVFSELCDFDIGIIPIDINGSVNGNGLSTSTNRIEVNPLWKSANRLTQMMALGLPVIASPVPAYKQVVQGGVNGYIAETLDDWVNAFEKLRDPRIRERIGKEARESVIGEYSQLRRAKELCILFDNLMKEDSNLVGRPS